MWMVVEPPNEATLELKFHPNRRDPSVIRKFVETYYGNLLHDGDTLYRVAMAAHEFMENAVKYSSDGAAQFTVELGHAPDAASTPRITLSLWNKAAPHHVAQLEQVFAEMDSFSDAFEHYKALMKRDAGDGSGIGLARIRAEGEMRLSLIRDGDRVCLRAQAEIGEGRK